MFLTRRHEAEGYSVHGRWLIIGRTVQANLNHYWMVCSSFATAFGPSFSSNKRWQALPVNRAASRYLCLATLHVGSASDWRVQALAGRLGSTFVRARPW